MRWMLPTRSASSKVYSSKLGGKQGNVLAKCVNLSRILRAATPQVLAKLHRSFSFLLRHLFPPSELHIQGLRMQGDPQVKGVKFGIPSSSNASRLFLLSSSSYAS
jgi:hypothetical protein